MNIKKFFVISKIISFFKWIFSSKDIKTAEQRIEHEVKESEKEIIK